MAETREERKRKNSVARIKANNKYNQKTYDYINAAVPKGNKLKIKEHAAAMGESVNAFINRAINEAMKRDKPILTVQNKPFTEDIENKVNLIKLLSDINYQLDIAESYGMDNLSILLSKARQQKSEREKAAEKNMAPMGDLDNVQ